MRTARELLLPFGMRKISWTGGGVVVRMAFNGCCDWGYCGGGPIFRNVKPSHFVASIESLLGWDHPAAQEARAFAKENP